MKNRTWLLVVAALLMIGSAAGLLVRMKAKQRLGEPGVRTRLPAEGRNLEVVLPEFVLDYASEAVAQQKIVVDTLPQDTCYGQRLYRGPDDFWTQVNVVLMGSDRTSLHKPQFCLEGAGWKIDHDASARSTIHMTRPEDYDLPVMKLLVTRQVEENGQVRTLRGVYVYWYVADGVLSGDPKGVERMWSMARTLLTTGVLQRWAFVTYFAVCRPGQEQATFERMNKLIVASVPEFQLTPKPTERVVAGQ